MASPHDVGGLESALRAKRDAMVAQGRVDERPAMRLALEAGGWQRQRDDRGLWVFSKPSSSMLVLLGSGNKAWFELNGQRRTMPPKARARIMSWNSLP